MKKKILLSLIVFVIVFAVGAVVKTKADDTMGWSWGGGTETDGTVLNPPFDQDGTNTNVRWISMNSKNCDIDIDGVMDRINIAPGTGDVTAPIGCPVDGTVVANYGIIIPENGNVTGNAWSGGDGSGPGLGYINFQPTAPLPPLGCNPSPCPVTGVVRNGNNLEGWARFEEIRLAGANAGLWEGWIKMSGIAGDGSPYGVTVNADGTLSGCIPSTGTGCAWSNELGWIDFSRASIAGTQQLEVCPPSVSMDIGGTGQLNAYYWASFAGTATCSTPGYTDVTQLATWSSDNINIASVENNPNGGRVTGVGNGTATITATYNSIPSNGAAIVSNICSYNLCDGSTSYQCTVKSIPGPCPASNCSDTITPETCNPPENKWIEVAP